MTTRHLIDPELLPALDAFRKVMLSAETLPAVRSATDEMGRQLASLLPPSLKVERSERIVPGPKGAPDVRVVVHVPKERDAGCGAYFHIHGGGYVTGTADMSDASNRALAEALGCVVVSVDYRLAPETAFPGNVEDCYAGLKWLQAHATEFGADPTRIAIGGESAGGGLAAALALLARDRGEVPIIHQQLTYPMIDDRPAANPNPHTGEFLWTAEHNRFGWCSLLGCEPGAPGVSPYAAAARADRLEGLPPTFIATGALDLFLDEDLEYARRLTWAGVPVELHVYPGAYHGFDLINPEARIARMYLRDSHEALRAAFARR